MRAKGSVMLVGIVLLIVVLAGCSSGGKKGDSVYTGNLTGNVRILVGGTADALSNPDSLPFLFNKIKQKLEADHPSFHLTLDFVPALMYEQMLGQRFVDGPEPDIYFVNIGQPSRYERKGTDLSVFAELDKIELEDYFSPSMLATVTLDGKIVSIPVDIGVIGILYWKSMFDQAGIPYPTPQWTWEDFVAAANQLYAEANKNNRPDRTGRTPGIYLPFMMESIDSFITANGGSILSPDGKMASGYLDGDASMQAIKNLVSLFHSGVAGEWKDGQSTYFLFKERGMGWMSYSATTELLKGTPVYMDNDLGYAPIPGMSGGPARYQLNGVRGVVINANSKNINAAWAFVRSMFMEESSFTPELLNKSLFISKQYGMSDDGIQNPLLKMIWSSVDGETMRTSTSNNAKYSAAIYAKDIQIFKRLNDLLVSDDVESDIRMLAKQLDPLLQ